MTISGIVHDFRSWLVGRHDGEREDAKREMKEASSRLQDEAAKLDQVIRERIDESDDPLWELVREMRYPVRRRPR